MGNYAVALKFRKRFLIFENPFEIFRYREMFNEEANSKIRDKARNFDIAVPR